MELKIECPSCNQHYSVDESFIGQTVECSVCGKEFTVRYPSDSTTQAKQSTIQTRNVLHTVYSNQEDDYAYSKKERSTAQQPNCNAPHLSRVTLRKSGKKVCFRVFGESVMPG